MAKKATKKLLEDPTAKVDRSVYGHDEVKAALEALFHGKCAYCEQFIEEFDVEHFRPKSRIKTGDKTSQPGYRWLAYAWSNLYLSCQRCNQHRTGKRIRGSAELDTPGGKADQFPLADEATRATSQNADHNNEIRLLIDPCCDEPAEHLWFGPMGKVFWLSEVGETSINVYNLNRNFLKRRRKRRRLEFGRLRSRLVTDEVEDYTGNAAEFAGACRDLIAERYVLEEGVPVSIARRAIPGQE